ncbi:MAG: hypothetical protein M1314_02645 [Firmicutes bacterium]|nr:hypothetical protein [Bacillota bacterium]
MTYPTTRTIGKIAPSGASPSIRAEHLRTASLSGNSSPDRRAGSIGDLFVGNLADGDITSTVTEYAPPYTSAPAATMGLAKLEQP